MGILSGLQRRITDLLVERPARNKDYAAWIVELETSGQAIAARAARGKYPDLTVKVLGHISGIERWSQRRLRVFLGEPFVRDEYDSYAPAATLSAEEQRAFFLATRAETIALVRQLAEAHIPESATVEHNSFGPLTARGWVSYLTGHAKREVHRIR